MKHRVLILIAILAVGLVGATGCGHSKTQAPEVTTPSGSSPSDQAPPQAPTGVNIPKADVNSFQVAWTRNAEPDIAGYNVYRYSPDPSRVSAWVLLNTAGLDTTNAWVYSGDFSAGVWICVSAVNTAQQESGYSSPVSVQQPKTVVPALPDPGAPGEGAPSVGAPGAHPPGEGGLSGGGL